jgi:hypothetical protein
MEKPRNAKPSVRWAMRVFSSEAQSPLGQPVAHGGDHLFGVLFALAEHDPIVGIPDDRARAADLTAAVVADAQRLLHSVQGYVRKERADHRPLAGPGRGLVKTPLST